MTDDASRTDALATILVQTSFDGLFAMDRETRYTLWNAAMERFAGKMAHEVLGRRVFDVFPFLRDLGLDRAIERAMAGEAVSTDGVPNVIPSGEVHYFDRLYLPMRDAAGSVVGVVGVIRDVTERRNAEEALRTSQEKLRMAVEASGIGLWSWDMQTDEVIWDDPLCKMAGLPAGKAPRGRAGYMALVHAEDRERVSTTIASGLPERKWEGEHRLVHPDGTVRWIITKGTVVRREGHDVALGAAIDVTERRARDEQLRQAQKLEAVGQLTAGIAHNFNNLLMAMLGNLGFVGGKVPAELQPMLRDAEQAAVRAAELVQQLMTFAGRNRPSVRRVEAVGPLVERIVAFCRTTLDRRIAIEATYDGSAWASVDEPQLEQAIVNILINSRDALLDGSIDEPRIAIRVDVVPDGASELGELSGEHVRVRIADNGPGMEAATVSRIFEPFFTTKDVGKGTGLGLATTLAIVREHGGLLTCDSSPGRGATFSIYLRRAPAASGSSASAPPPAPARLRGKETVLVVDDEAPIRTVVARMLEQDGYRARLAASGQEAVDMLSDQKAASEVALVLLDVSMPGLSGRELRLRLGELAPRARVVYFTGYAYEACDPQDAVLEKPITSQRLLETVRAVLDRPLAAAQ